MFNLAFAFQTAKELWACQFEFQLQFGVRHPDPALSVYHSAPVQGLALQAALSLREHLRSERIYSWFEFEQRYGALCFVTMFVDCFRNPPCATTQMELFSCARSAPAQHTKLKLACRLMLYIPLSSLNQSD